MSDDRFNSELFLTTSQVADLLDVHPSTVKRWCNDEELHYAKTDGGHRRIHLKDALDLARERDIPTFLQPFRPYEGHVWSAVSEVVEGPSYERVHTLAMGWLRRGKMDRLAQLFFELGRHPEIPFPSLCDRGIAGFMRLVGEAWRSGQLRVGEEHMVTEVLTEVLVRLRSELGYSALAERSGNGSPGAPRSRNGNGAFPDAVPTGPAEGLPVGVAIVGSMEGDRHSLAPQCLRLLLERRGWQVYYLGADVPVEDFSAMQKARGAGLVAVSFAPPSTGADMKRCIRILSEFYDRTHPFSLALGGIPSESVDLSDLSPPFVELSVFDSISGFDEALDAGFSTQTAE